MVALGAFEKHVRIVDLSTKKTQAEFETILDYGGRRMAIHENGSICVCGCWERHGIVGYSGRDGAILWQRQDLKKLQRLRPLITDPDRLFAEFEKGASYIIDYKSGRTINYLPRIEDYSESAYEPINLQETSKHFTIVGRDEQKTICRMARQSFGTLEVAFGPKSVCISESGKPLCCYDTKSGRPKWVVDSKPNEHALRLHFNKTMNRYLGVFWPYDKGGAETLKIIHPDTGLIEDSVSFPNMIESAFALAGEVLIGIHIVSKKYYIRLYNIRTGKTEELS